MKKLIAMAMCIVTVFSMTGCSASESKASESAVSDSSVNQSTKNESTATETTAKESTEKESTEKESTDKESTEKESAANENKASDVTLSGKVIVYCPSPANLADDVAAAFTQKTGVEVEMFQGTTGEILARLETEKGNPVADVVIMASWADGLSMVKDDMLLSYKPEHADKLYPDWMDENQMIYGYSASAVGVIYNTTKFETLAADWSELGSDSAYKDEIVMPDPVKSGSCKDFLCGYFNFDKTVAQGTVDQWVANGLSIPGANKAALEAVTTGEKNILIAGVDYNAYSAIAKGEPLGIYYPSSGTVINPRPAMILKTSQNVDNAKAFMDFLLSDEAQKLVGEAYLLPGRSDITTDKRTNVSDIKVFALDWKWMMENSEEIANNLVNSCK